MNDMETKEQKAKEYADYAHKLVEEFYERKCAEHDFYYKNADIQLAFETGWDESLENLWIKVEDALPNNSDEFLILLMKVAYAGADGFEYIVMLGKYHDNKFSLESRHLKVIAWMPIPSFDSILESNKDVLKRLKDR